MRTRACLIKLSCLRARAVRRKRGLLLFSLGGGSEGQRLRAGQKAACQLSHSVRCFSHFELPYYTQLSKLYFSPRRRSRVQLYIRVKTLACGPYLAHTLLVPYSVLKSSKTCLGSLLYLEEDFFFPINMNVCPRLSLCLIFWHPDLVTTNTRSSPLQNSVFKHIFGNLLWPHRGLLVFSHTVSLAKIVRPDVSYF